MEENPFPDLHIDSSDFLDNLTGRSKCSKCEKSRKYYCYNCYIPVPEIKEKVPKVKLPIKVDVIKHPSEVDGKSTAVHAAVLAPDDVTVYTYPCIPDYDIDKTVLIFPGETSVTLSELSEKWGGHRNQSTGKRKVSTDEEVSCTVGKIPRLENTEMSVVEKSSDENTSVSKEDENIKKSSDNSSSEKMCGNKNNSSVDDTVDKMSEAKSDMKDESLKIRSDSGLVPFCKVERVVFVDSTWNQTKTICSDERLRGLQCIELRTRETKFWRHQKDIPSTYLSTVEAIYYFLREFHEQFVHSKYSGQYDNLLFFFTYMYKKIRTLYDGGNELRAYKERAGK